MTSKQRHAAYMREWRANNIELCLQKESERRRRDKTRILARAKTHYEKNRARISAQAKARRLDDPWRAVLVGKTQAANRRYPGRLTVSDVAGVFERGNGTCCWCGLTGLSGRELTLEHLEPVNDVRCLAVACSACNIARIPARGPRKSKAQQIQENRDRVKSWRIANRDRYNARWWKRSDDQKVRRKAYMREYMRKRRALAVGSRTSRG